MSSHSSSPFRYRSRTYERVHLRVDLESQFANQVVQLGYVLNSAKSDLVKEAAKSKIGK